MTRVKSSACNAKELQASRERLLPIMRNMRFVSKRRKPKMKKKKKKFKEKQKREILYRISFAVVFSKSALGRQVRD